jgi:hypothetical protein
VYFKAFEDDSPGCSVTSEECTVIKFQDYAVPAPGTSASYTLTIPQSGNASWGSVSFTITATGSFTVCPITATNNCGVPNITQSPAPGTSLALGNHVVTLRATDASGNEGTCSFTVNVLDAVAPTLTGPANQSLNVISGTCAANYTIADPISDNCTGATWGYSLSGATIATVASIADGTNSGVISFNKGITTVTLSGTDGTNNATTTSFTVTVTDNQAPSFVVAQLAPITTPATQSCAAAVIIESPAATDNCGVDRVTGIRSDGMALNARYPLGVTTISWTATDINGNTNAPLVQTINVIGGPTNSTEPIVACSSYNWHGTTYTSSNNTATWTGTNAAGCDSIVTLNLTINQPSYTTETIDI